MTRFRHVYSGCGSRIADKVPKDQKTLKMAEKDSFVRTPSFNLSDLLSSRAGERHAATRRDRGHCGGRVNELLRKLLEMMMNLGTSDRLP